MSDVGDPRVYFAAERTLLAWNRTSLAMMGFGFIVERFGLFLQMLSAGRVAEHHRPVSLWLGVLFVLLGAGVAAVSTVQFERVVRRLPAVDFPPEYWIHLGAVANLALALLGLFMAAYLVLS